MFYRGIEKKHCPEIGYKKTCSNEYTRHRG